MANGRKTRTNIRNKKTGMKNKTTVTRKKSGGQKERYRIKDENSTVGKRKQTGKIHTTGPGGDVVKGRSKVVTSKGGVKTKTTSKMKVRGSGTIEKKKVTTKGVKKGRDVKRSTYVNGVKK